MQRSGATTRGGDRAAARGDLEPVHRVSGHSRRPARRLRRDRANDGQPSAKARRTARRVAAGPAKRRRPLPRRHLAQAQQRQRNRSSRQRQWGPCATPTPRAPTDTQRPRAPTATQTAQAPADVHTPAGERTRCARQSHRARRDSLAGVRPMPLPPPRLTAGCGPSCPPPPPPAASPRPRALLSGGDAGPRRPQGARAS